MDNAVDDAACKAVSDGAKVGDVMALRRPGLGEEARWLLRAQQQPLGDEDRAPSCPIRCSRPTTALAEAEAGASM